MITSKLTIAVAVLAAASMVAAPLLLGEQAFATDKKVVKKSISVSRDNIVNNVATNIAEASGQCSNTAGIAGAQTNACTITQIQTNLGQTGAIADSSINNFFIGQ